MRRPSLLRSAAAVLFIFALVAPARAGQVRVAVGSGGNTFTPSTVSANVGDQVVWFWAGSGHTVTSGTTGTAAGDGKFRSTSSVAGMPSGSGFFWKVTGSGSVAYYCLPHFPSMTGAISINPSGTASVANFRITEVEFAAGAGQDRVQISNLGNNGDFIDIYRVTSSSTPTTLGTNIFLGSGSSLTLHLNASGTNDFSNIFLPGIADLSGAGSFAIYVPNTTTAPGGSTAPASLGDPDQMVDYVEWGTVGQAAQPNRATAVAAGLWNTGDVVDVTDLPNGGAGYSLAFCGTPTSHGASFWAKAKPNFGASPLCTTPTRSSTWGRLKALYR